MVVKNLKLLITGANGNIGSYLCYYFKNTFEIIPYDNHEDDVYSYNTEKYIMANLPQAVIHTDEISNIYFCERNEEIAYKTNTVETKNIAFACKRLDIPLIYISTAHVFNGKKNNPYFEDDPCEALNIYGKTKFYGEQLIRTLCEKYFILRTSWVFGGNICFIKKIIDSKFSPLFEYSNNLISPTYIVDLCVLIEKMLKSNLYGVYHCTNERYLTIEEYVNIICSITNINANVIYLPNNIITNSVETSRNTALSSKFTNENFQIKPPLLEERLKEYIKTL